MTTFNTYKCSICKRVTEIEVDPARPSYNQCNITYKCTGKLQKTGTTTSRAQLLSVPVTGLTNWRSRHLANTSTGTSNASTNVPISTGKGTLTIAVNGVDPNIDVLTMVLEIKNSAGLPFKHYSFTNFAIPAASITGVDSTPERKIFRYAGAGENFDLLTVTMNGVTLKRAVRATGFANIMSGVVVSVTIEQEGSGYDSPPEVVIGGNGSGAVGVAKIENGAVKGVTITSAGNSYSGVVPVSFTGGVQHTTVYYSLPNEIQFAPPVPVGSKVDAIVTPYVAPEKVELYFARNTQATVGSWSNVSTIFMCEENHDIFTSVNLDILDKEIHLKPLHLTANQTTLANTEWCFVLSTDPHEHADRVYSLRLESANAELSRTGNSLHVQDVLVNSMALTSVYPPIEITSKLSTDKNQNSVSNLDARFLANPHIVGMAP